MGVALLIARLSSIALSRVCFSRLGLPFLVLSLPHLLFSPARLLAQPIADLKTGTARIQLERVSSDNYKLSILPLVTPLAGVRSGGPGKANEGPVRVLILNAEREQPRRLVLDYFGLTGKGAKKVTVKDKHIRSLRLADHSDRLRVVVDIRNEETVKFQGPNRLGKGDGYRVEFSLLNPKPPVAKPTPLVTPTPKSPIVKLAPQASPTIGASIGEPHGLADMPVTRTPQPTPVFNIVRPTPTLISQTSSSPLPTAEIGVADEMKRMPTPYSTPPVVGQRPPSSELRKEGNAAGTIEPEDEEDEDFEVRPNESEPAVTQSTPMDTPAVRPETPIVQLPPGSSGGSGPPRLSDIGFERLKDSQASALYLVLQPLESYSLQKRKADLYELVIQGGKLQNSTLTQPRFAPDGVQGFDVVVAKEDGGALVVQIFVEEGIRLFPFVAEGRLWVKALK